jgi:glutathione S-transferase
MIDFYCWRSGNNRKIFMMLEEAGLEYARHIVNLDSTIWWSRREKIKRPQASRG